MSRRRPRTSDARFSDRREAGAALADVLARRGFERPVVVALPRGGVPVGAEIAARLHAPLDVLVVRKLGCPGRPELGIGAVAEGGVRLENEWLMSRLAIAPIDVDRIAEAEWAEVERRARRYRGARPAVRVRDRTAIVVDDGLATGFTARAAITALRARRPYRVVLAVPVGASETVAQLREVTDEVVCLRMPADFAGVGQWYADFRQVPDDVVIELLTRHATADGAPRASSGEPAGQRSRAVRIPVGRTLLAGTLTVPPDPIGIVVFAHGSGSSRLSPRNVAVARALNRRRLATLLFDLLDSDEAADRRNAFDIGLLAERLDRATEWVAHHGGVGRLPIGYFGASTGAAAALVAAAHRSGIGAIVSRGGRPDLAAGDLAKVTAPTLLIVGHRDTSVVALNQRVLPDLGQAARLEVVPGATHLFSEHGALERVAALAVDWFTTHLPTRSGGIDTAEAPRSDGPTRTR